MNFQLRLRKIFLSSIILLSLLITDSFGQLSVGVKATSPTVSAKESSRSYYEPVNNTEYTLNYISTKSTYGIGLSFYQELEKVFILSDVLYKQTTAEFRLSTLNDVIRAPARVFDVHRVVSIPIIAGYRNKNLKFGLGPVFNVKMQSEYGLMNFQGFNLQERKVNKAVQFLIGIKIKDHLHVDLRHEINFGSEGDDYNVVGHPLKIHSHPQSFSVSIGVFL